MERLPCTKNHDESFSPLSSLLLFPPLLFLLLLLLLLIRRVMADYVDVIHRRVKADPSTVVLLRAAFIKLASMLEVPLIRINQCDSPDTISVAQYYSSEMVEFLRQVSKGRVED